MQYHIAIALHNSNLYKSIRQLLQYLTCTLANGLVVRNISRILTKRLEIIRRVLNPDYVLITREHPSSCPGTLLSNFFFIPTLVFWWCNIKIILMVETSLTTKLTYYLPLKFIELSLIVTRSIIRLGLDTLLFHYFLFTT